MSLKEDLSKKDFVVTAEINPPKSTNVVKALNNVNKLKNLVSAVNITDNSGGGAKMCPAALGHIVQQQTEVEIIWQITCRDRNRFAIQSDLLGIAALGLNNILPLRGDPPPKDSGVAEEKCFDLGTEDLIKGISAFNSGKDFAGEALADDCKTDFCIGAAAHPGMPDLAAQTETMKRRESLGVDFFQTQICFDKEQLHKFIEAIGDELASKTLLGVCPIKSLGQAEFMNKNIWGVDVPEDIIKGIKEAGSKAKDEDEKKELERKKGLEYFVDFVKEIKKTPLKGIHVMAIGQENKLDEIISATN